MQAARATYQPKLPAVLNASGPFAKAVLGKATKSVADQAAIKKLFPDTYGLPAVKFEKGAKRKVKALNVAVILSGGQAPGGHNVIAGLYDGLKALNAQSKLYGFLGGPSGLIDNKYMLLTDDIINAYRNTGGFDMICSGRTKLEKPEQFDKVIVNCKALDINAIVIIGGDDSNTNACVLAQYMIDKKTGIQVIGCPKTIDGDLKNEWIEVSFGFDTATKVYSELIGNIMRDANSAKKYWHFIKLMGRSASHIALECGLQTQPNICIVSEEVEAKKMTLSQIVNNIADTVAARAAQGNNFGVILIPEGLIEFIPEMKVLIAELNDLLAHESDVQKALKGLTPGSAAVYASLPEAIAKQLTLDRDPHGNVQVSLIETEKLLIEMVKKRLADMKKEGKYVGKFSGLGHFFGYEGRCAAPSNFDADYCYSLGFTASVLAFNKMNGYMSSVRDLTKGIEKWTAGGIPITMMMNIERRHGADKPVIQKALVELDGAPFKFFAKNRDVWATTESYTYPGPIQYWGPSEVCDVTNFTIKLERGALKVK